MDSEEEEDNFFELDLETDSEEEEEDDEIREAKLRQQQQRLRRKAMASKKIALARKGKSSNDSGAGIGPGLATSGSGTVLGGPKTKEEFDDDDEGKDDEDEGEDELEDETSGSTTTVRNRKKAPQGETDEDPLEVIADIQNRLKKAVGGSPVPRKAMLKRAAPTAGAPGAPAREKREGCGYLFWIFFVGFVVFTVVSRYQMEIYDVDYDEFMSHYSVLGLPESASYKEVRKAYRSLSLKWHPDKNPPDCLECKEKYIAITRAYETISEFEKGNVHLVNRPGEEGDAKGKGRPNFKPGKARRGGR